MADGRCRFQMIAAGFGPIPRSCPRCGLGGCALGLPDPLRDPGRYPLAHETTLPRIDANGGAGTPTPVSTRHPRPEIGSLWRHYRGRIYRVVENPMDTDTGLDLCPERVFYVRADVDAGRAYARRLEEWHDEVSPGRGRFVPLRRP